jgi:hypothetical protein
VIAQQVKTRRPATRSACRACRKASFRRLNRPRGRPACCYIGRMGRPVRRPGGRCSSKGDS